MNLIPIIAKSKNYAENLLFFSNKLQDGKEVESDCLSYSPEYGYFLNLTKLEEPYGKYECKVVNSTDDDVVSMVLQLGNYRLNTFP